MGDHLVQTNTDEYDERMKSEEIKQEPNEYENVAKLDIHENNFDDSWLKVPKNEDIRVVANSLYEVGYGSDTNEQSTVKLEDSKWYVHYGDGHKEDNATEIKGENINVKSEIIDESLDLRNINGPKIKLYQCNLCDYKTKRRYDLVRHFRLKHDEAAELFKCELCAYKTKAKNYLRIHIRKVHLHGKIQKTGPFHCRYCGYETNNKYYFSKHVKRLHENVKWHCCHICEYKTKHKVSLQSHFRCKHEEDIEYYQCEFCETKFKSKYTLERHIRYKHKENPKFFECQLCEFKSKYSSCLTQHIKRVHNPSRQSFECRLCYFSEAKKKVSSVRYSETNHDEAAKSLLCHLPASEKREQMCHHKIKSYHCRYCDFETNQANYLKRHVRSLHENIVWYHCNICDYKSKYKAGLQSHFSNNHEENIEYQCEFCEYKTKNKYYLKPHVERKHAGNSKVANV